MLAEDEELGMCDQGKRRLLKINLGLSEESLSGFESDGTLKEDYC